MSLFPNRELSELSRRGRQVAKERKSWHLNLSAWFECTIYSKETFLWAGNPLSSSAPLSKKQCQKTLKTSSKDLILKCHTMVIFLSQNQSDIYMPSWLFLRLLEKENLHRPFLSISRAKICFWVSSQRQILCQAPKEYALYVEEWTPRWHPDSLLTFLFGGYVKKTPEHRRSDPNIQRHTRYYPLLAVDRCTDFPS